MLGTAAQINQNVPASPPLNSLRKTKQVAYPDLNPIEMLCETEFDWQQYLQSTDSQSAPAALFTCCTGVSIQSGCGFRVGMKLEAVDRKNPGLVCVASVADVIDDYRRTTDFFCFRPYIHPVGWCHPNPENFVWEEYLQETGSTAAPISAFTLVRIEEAHAHMEPIRKLFLVT
uniref:Uncharacterized protein n=1 Tax=Neolamprologus brichardi TaxID=32507 RepID=A0A3Q4HI39_NEOBR